MKMFNNIINRIHKFFKDYPVWSIFCGTLTFIFTLHWLTYALFWKEAPNYVNDYVDYMEYDIKFMYSLTWSIICGLGSVLFWIDVYKFFKNKK